MFSRLFINRIIVMIIMVIILIDCLNAAFKPIKGQNIEKVSNLRESPGRGSSSNGPTNTGTATATHSRVGSSDTLDLKDIPVAVKDSSETSSNYREAPIILISPTDMQKQRPSKSKFSSTSSIADGALSFTSSIKHRELATPEPPSDKQPEQLSMETPIIDISKSRSKRKDRSTITMTATLNKSTDEMNHLMMMAPFAQKSKETQKLSSSPKPPPHSRFVGQSRILATPNDSDQDRENDDKTDVIEFDGILKLPPSTSTKPSKPTQDIFDMPLLTLYQQPTTPQLKSPTNGQEFNIPIATDNSFNTEQQDL